MDSLVFRCPGCQQPFQVLAEQAGQVVRCPGCQSTVEIPATAPKPQLQDASSTTLLPESDAADVRSDSVDQPPAEQVQAYGCPKCEKPFGIYPSMFGSEMACPHCRETILVQRKAQRSVEETDDSSKAVGAAVTKAKRKPKQDPKTKRPVSAAQKSKTPNPIQPSVSAAVVKSDGVASADSPQQFEGAVTNTGSSNAAPDPIAKNQQLCPEDLPDDTPIVVFTPQPVDHLLPPKFSAVDPAFFYRRHQDGSQVLLPSADGGLKVVDNRIVRIEHNGQVYELISSPRYERIQRVIVTNVLAVIICGLLIAIAMTLLKG